MSFKLLVKDRCVIGRIDEKSLRNGRFPITPLVVGSHTVLVMDQKIKRVILDNGRSEGATLCK